MTKTRTLSSKSKQVSPKILNTSSDRHNVWYWGSSSEQKDTDLDLLGQIV